MKNGKSIVPIHEANMEAALRSQYHRTRDTAIDLRMPFDRLISFEEALAQEDDGIENTEAIGDYEMRQRVIGVRAFLRWLKTRAGVSSTSAYRPGPVSNIMMQLFAAGRALQDPFFSSMSFTENGLLFSQTKAGASHRSKLLSKEMEKAGAKGIQQPGQKTPESSGVYAETAKRTRNRAKRPQQGSFLRKFQIPSSKPQGNFKSQAPKQKTFTRQLSGGGSNPPSPGYSATGGASGGKSASAISSAGDSGRYNAGEGSRHTGPSHITRSVA